MIQLVKGNKKPDLAFVIYEEGEPKDLTGCTVVFKLRKPVSKTVLEKTLSIIGDPMLGVVAGSWGTGDLDEGGPTFAEVVVTDADGNPQNGKRPIPCYVRAEFEEPEL